MRKQFLLNCQSFCSSFLFHFISLITKCLISHIFVITTVVLLLLYVYVLTIKHIITCVVWIMFIVIISRYIYSGDGGRFTFNILSNQTGSLSVSSCRWRHLSSVHVADISIMAESSDIDQLLMAFKKFAVHGDTKASGNELNGKNWNKLCKDCKITDSKNVCSTDVDIVFSKVK